MRVVVIGATGHIGGYLVPRLVGGGHEVVTISRGQRQPYRAHPAWQQVTRIEADRDAEDAAGTFAGRIADLGADVVVDLLCFTPDSARQLVQALRGRVGQLVHCGTVWVHGPAVEVPVTEDAPRRPFGDYGVQKAAIERLLLTETHRGGLNSTVLHPGHISGPGWPIITPAGDLNPGRWHTLATGGELTLPNLGLETLHHVHADDVAQAFELAVRQPGAAAGESFHVVSERAVTFRGFAEAAAAWFGREANLRYLPWEQYRETVSADDAGATSDHLHHSPSVSIDKARRVLGYAPRFTSVQTAAQAVHWLAEHGQVDLDGRQVPVS